MFRELRKNEGLWITLVNSLISFSMVVIKFSAGILGRSTALIADAFHSLADLLNDVVVMFTFQIGRLPKDAEHPYGHGRAETIGAAIIGSCILLLSAGMIREAWHIIATGQYRIPSWVAAATAAASIVAKYRISRHTRAVGEKLHSPSIIANASDQRADAISSLAALIGIVGAMNGYPILDPLAAAGVGLMILKTGIGVIRDSLRDLMDSSLEAGQIEKIGAAVKDAPGVRHLHDLRARRSGGEILVDVHILVDPWISVTEGHNIAEAVRRELYKHLPNMQDALIHVDPEDDSSYNPFYPAGREELRRLIAPVLTGADGLAVDSEDMRINYVNGKTFIELFAKTEKPHTLAEARQALRDLKMRLETLDPVDEAHIYLHLTKHRTNRGKTSDGLP